MLKMISLERLQKTSKIFSPLLRIYILAFYIGTFVGLISSSSFRSLHQNNQLIDVNWVRFTSNIYLYIPLLIFSGLFIIFVLFYPGAKKETVDKFTKCKGCCFSQQNESFEPDCSARNPCTKIFCEIKCRKLLCHG